MPDERPDIYAGLAGAKLAVDRFDLGDGIILEQTFAHLMGPLLMAFSPSQGGPHPAPWRAVSDGVGFDVHIQIHFPASLEQSVGIGQEGAFNWVNALLRLRIGPTIVFPVFSNAPFQEGKERENGIRYWPYEIEARMLRLTTERIPILHEIDLAWVARHWKQSSDLAHRHLDFYFLLEAMHQCAFAKRSNLALLWLWAGLEGVFSPAKTELRYRISALIAAYLEQPGEARLQLQKRIAKLYDGRSTSAHGRDDKAHDSLVNTFELVRRVVTKMIEENAVPTAEQLEARLFGVDSPGT